MRLISICIGGTLAFVLTTVGAVAQERLQRAAGVLGLVRLPQRARPGGQQHEPHQRSGQRLRPGEDGGRPARGRTGPRPGAPAAIGARAGRSQEWMTRP